MLVAYNLQHKYKNIQYIQTYYECLCACVSIEITSLETLLLKFTHIFIYST